MNELSYYLDTCPDFVKNNFSLRFKILERKIGF